MWARRKARKQDASVRTVLGGYGLSTDGTPEERQARLLAHFEEHPEANLEHVDGAALEEVALQYRKWYHRGTGLRINSTWCLGGQRRRAWQPAAGSVSFSATDTAPEKQEPPPLALGPAHAKPSLTVEVPPLEQPLRSPPAPELKSPGLPSRTPKTPRTPGGSVIRRAKMLFADV